MKKRLVLTFISVFAMSFAGLSQNYRITDAEFDVKNGDYGAAKTAIDEALTNAQTANSPRMWKTRGDVYYWIAADSISTHLDPEAASVSVQSYINAINTDKLEKKQKYTEEAMIGLRKASVYAYLRAYAHYQLTDYNKALEYYSLLLTAYDTDVDGGIAKSLQQAKNDIVQYCANLAIKLEDKAKAKKFLNMMMDDPKYLSANAYLQMSTMLMEEGDTTAALDVIGKGRKKVPDNKDLFNQELGIYSQLGKTKILIKKLSEVIESEPNNILYRYYRGTIVSDYASKIVEGGPQYSDSASDYRRKVRSARNPNDKKKLQASVDMFLHLRDSIYAAAGQEFDVAEKDFNEALLIDPYYFDALFNLGVLYFNKNKSLVDQYNYIDLSEQGAAKLSKELEAKMKVDYEKAVEQLLKAFEIHPDDAGVLLALQQTYSQLGQKYISTYYKLLKDDGKPECDLLEIKKEEDLTNACGEPTNKTSEVKNNKTYTTYEYPKYSILFINGEADSISGL